MLVNTGVLVSCEVKFSWFFIFQVILDYILDIFNIVLLDLGSFLNPIKCYLCFSRQSALLDSALSTHTAVGVSFGGLGWRVVLTWPQKLGCLPLKILSSWWGWGRGSLEGLRKLTCANVNEWILGGRNPWICRGSWICRGCTGAVSEADFLSGRSCWGPLPAGHWGPWKSLLFSLVPGGLYVSAPPVSG